MPIERFDTTTIPIRDMRVLWRMPSDATELDVILEAAHRQCMSPVRATRAYHSIFVRRHFLPRFVWEAYWEALLADRKIRMNGMYAKQKE